MFEFYYFIIQVFIALNNYKNYQYLVDYCLQLLFISFLVLNFRFLRFKYIFH